MRPFAPHLLVAIALMTAAPRAVAQFGVHSAAGTHECRPETGGNYSCIVSGPAFGTCIDATSSLRLQDCCPNTRVCERDRVTGETKCRTGGKSVGFTLNYCIESGRF